MNTEKCCAISCIVIASPLLVAISVVSFAVIPVVSLVAISIFAAKTCISWSQHQSLYDKTVIDQTRARFGRTEDEDYTRWDGKAVEDQERAVDQHEKMNSFPKGFSTDESDNVQLLEDYPFKTQEDLDWLNNESARIEKKRILNNDRERFVFFCKLAIPIFGAIWVVRDLIKDSTRSEGYWGEATCSACNSLYDDKPHWSGQEALAFHQNQVRPFLKIIWTDECPNCMSVFEDTKGIVVHYNENKTEVLHPYCEDCFDKMRNQWSKCTFCQVDLEGNILRIKNPHFKEKEEAA